MRERKKTMESDKERRKSKTRRQSVTLRRDSICRKAKDDEQEQEIMEVEPCSRPNEKSTNSKKAKEPRTDESKVYAHSTLMTNNRALAAALEGAQLELRSVQHQNIQLKEQIHDNHRSFVEKTSELERQLRSLEQLSGNHASMAAQAVFHDVYKLLNQTCTQFLQGSNFLSDALHLVSSYLTPAEGQIKYASPHVVLDIVSPHVDPASNTICTTPPPDDLSAMEITATQSIIIETNDTEMEHVDRGCEKNQPSLYLEQENVNAKVESDVMEMEVSESQMESRRAKRKSSTGVSYAEPGLRSKLRRGDRYTDSRLCGKESQMNNRKRKSKGSTTLPTMGSAKKRAPLGNLTNIIAEES
ncbi:hypothetical protein OS493_016269 [Desmophyllum pertusum]|uniref:Shugoshin C-terminal domain-containing protein n=1 Tax=Desmophyllum pertusum TaxID=174260 RepID=A0A9X0D965_9CNID|nr:hypothetical protein OS493_016269 [Desmophyllum pertusum]